MQDPTSKLFNALDLSREQILTGILLEYVTRMGVGGGFVVRAAVTAPDQMHYFSKAELDEWKVTYNPSQFGLWSIEPYGNGVIALSRSADKKATAKIYCRADRRARFLLSHKIDADKRGEEGGFETIEGADILGFTVPRQAMSAYINGGGLSFGNCN